MKNIMKDKAGNYADVFVFIIMAFVIVVFFGLMYYGFSSIDVVLTNIDIDFGNQGMQNMTNIVDATWGEVYDAYDQLKTIAYVLIFGMMLTILVGSWTIKRPPIYLIFYIIVSIGAIISGAYVSNAYQGLLANAEFGATLESFKGGSYMLLYLPYLAGIISLFSGLIGLIGLNKSKREDGGIPA